MESTGDKARRRHMKLDVWGTKPIMRSEHISNQGASKKVLVARAVSSMSKICIPKAYTDAINSPKGKLWKEVMDYSLNLMR